MNRIDAILERVNGPTVLDLGCVQPNKDNIGDEDWLHGRLVDAYDRVVGVDIDERAVRKLNTQGYTVHHADVEAMNLDIQADTVVAGELIEHVSNPGLLLDRIGEHTKPTGNVILTTPNPWAIVHLRRHIDGSFTINDEHTAWYGPQTLRQLFARHGFTITELTGVGPDHNGLTGLAQTIGSDTFGSVTWLVEATRSW